MPGSAPRPAALHLLAAGGRSLVRGAEVTLRLAQTAALVVDPTGGQERARRNALAATAADATRARERMVAGQAVPGATTTPRAWIRAL